VTKNIRCVFTHLISREQSNDSTMKQRDDVTISRLDSIEGYMPLLMLSVVVSTLLQRRR